MTLTAEDVCTLEDLRTFVHHVLCERENLLHEQFALTEMTLRRRDRECGVQFSLQGPRSVRLGAVWASDHNVVYLYDACGERFAKIALPHRVHADRAAA